MYELDTPRLRIIPLTPAQCRMWLQSPRRLAESLGIREMPPPCGHLREAMRGLFAAARQREGSFPWMTSWQMVLRDEGIAVGSACFMAPPDAAGGVEIGYGLREAYRGRGLMAEALGALTAWALAQAGVCAVMAEIEKGNAPSRRVLERCGFAPVPGTEGRLFRLAVAGADGLLEKGAVFREGL